MVSAKGEEPEQKRRKNMKKFAVIDQIADGDQFEDIFDSADEAIAFANKEWNHLSEKDKKRRAEFFVVECELDENDCVALDTAVVILTIK